MKSSTTLKITVFGLLWTTQILAEASLPVPALDFHQPFNSDNIELFSRVKLVCSPPKNAPYPITVILGRRVQPLSGLLTYHLTSADDIFFTLGAVAENEGIFVCWYNVSKNGEVSGISGPINLTISSLPRPTILVQPDFIPVGGNYTAYCQAPQYFFNITLSLFYRNVTQGTEAESPRLLGSLNLTGSNNVIKIDRWQVDEKWEFLCSMEMIYNHRHYSSPLSSPGKAVTERAPVRLLSRFQSIQCAGRAEVFVQDDWGPVCQTGSSSSTNMALGAVACRELGCGTRARVRIRQGHEFQLPAKLPSLGPVVCNGNEELLRHCQIATVKPSCRDQVEVICSDFLPAPQLSVTGGGSGSRVYITKKDSVEITCTLNAPRLGKETVELKLLEVNRRMTLNYMTVTNGEAARMELMAPVPNGEYGCYAAFHGFSDSFYSEPGNTVIIAEYIPPDWGLIFGALTATLIGVGILVYMCIYRVHKEEVQSVMTTQGADTTDHPIAAAGAEPAS